MSEQTGEKTEEPTAAPAGGIRQARPDPPERGSADGLCPDGRHGGADVYGQEMWRQLVETMVLTLSHLHDTSLSVNSLQGYAVSGTWLFIKCAGRS
jgi:hypothetical protein